MDNSQNYIVDIIKNCDIAFLSTINSDKFSECRAMDNGYNKNKIDKNFEIYFASHTNSPKTAQIKNNYNASLYYSIASNMKSVTLFGKVEMLNDTTIKNKVWQDEWLAYFQNGKNDELYGVLKFVPTGYKYYAIIGTEYRKIEEKF